MTIQTLIDCWRITHEDATFIFNPPATETEICEAEAKIGAPLPSPLREIYLGFTNEPYLLGGCLSFFPIEATDFVGLTDANEKYIEWGRHIPQEILLFADNGGGHSFGIWLSETGNPIFQHPIIEVGELHEVDGCMGVAGTNLVSFLHGLTAYHLMQSEIDVLNAVDDGEADAPTELEQLQIAFCKLQVPEELRYDPFYDNYKERFGIDYTEDRVERHFPLIRKWADPSLPDPYGDSYSQRYTVTDLKQLFGGA